MLSDFKTLISQLDRGLPCGRYIIKIATSEEEREAVYRLRYRVFNEELGEGIPENAVTGMDHDEFDPYCDHLLLITDGKVVATYRMLWGPKAPPSGFYTETEFRLRNLPVDFNQSVELGRVCIDPHFRQKTTFMTLLWGLHIYCEYREAEYLLGCGTLICRTPNDAEATYEALQAAGHVHEVPGVSPLEKNQFRGDARLGQADVPPLLKLYFEFGAKIYCRPAYDPIFKCYDLLVAFNMKALSPWGTELLARFDRRLVGKSETT